MTTLIKPNIVEVSIKIINGQMILSAPDDKLQALAMLALAQAIISREIMGQGSMAMPSGLAS